MIAACIYLNVNETSLSNITTVWQTQRRWCRRGGKWFWMLL